MILFLTIIIAIVLVILLVSLVTYFNSKGKGNEVLGNDEITALSKIINVKSLISVKGKGIIDWGDGTSEAFDLKSKTNVNHIYPATGDYQITVKGNIYDISLGEIQGGGGEFFNIRVFNINIKNCKKLDSLKINFVSYDSGNTEKYFLNGLENCESLINLLLNNSQGIIPIPNNHKIENLILYNNQNNYITEIQNLYNQENLKILSLVNIPTDIYSIEGVFDTNNFNSLTNLFINGLDSSLDTLILTENIQDLNLQNTAISNVIGFDENNFKYLNIQNILYFDNLTSINFSNNTILNYLNININNNSDINVILPNQADNLTYLSLIFNNLNINTITGDINSYANLATLYLENITLTGNILDLSSLEKLISLYNIYCSLTDIQLSTNINQLTNVYINNNQIQSAELNTIGNALLAQNVSYGTLNISNNPGTPPDTSSSPWSDLVALNWDVQI